MLLVFQTLDYNLGEYRLSKLLTQHLRFIGFSSPGPQFLSIFWKSNKLCSIHKHSDISIIPQNGLGIAIAFVFCKCFLPNQLTVCVVPKLCTFRITWDGEDAYNYVNECIPYTISKYYLLLLLQIDPIGYPALVSTLCINHLCVSVELC